MKTTVELPEEVLQRAKIAAIQRKTTLKELICRSLIREIELPQAGSTDAESQRKKRASALLDSLDAIQVVTPIGRFDRKQAECHPSPARQMPEEDRLPYVIDPRTGMARSRSLNTPGFVPPTPEESQAMIERANEEEDLRRAGLLR